METTTKTELPATTSNPAPISLTEETRRYCASVLNETEETRTHSLKAIKAWAGENPHYHIKLDNSALIPFLRSCKFDIERTKTKLISYHTMRRDIPEWYSNRDPNLPEIQELVKLGVFVPLRKTHDNQMVIIARTAAHNPKVHKQDNVFKAANMILDVATRDNECAQVFGIVAIFDMAGISFGHARQLTPGIIKKAVTSWQNYHCRPKKLEFVNAPVYINVVLNIFKGFMSEKLKGRVSVHFNGLEALHRIVPKEILPREYGGDDESLDEILAYWQEKLIEAADWFKEDEKYKAE